MRRRHRHLKKKVLVIILLIIVGISLGIYHYMGNKDNKENNISKPNEENNNKENLVLYEDPALNGAIPELDERMIPVIYRDGSWLKADPYKAWYDYAKLAWANVVYVTDDTYEKYKDNPVETIIKMEDILGFFVWIPRFEYKLFNVNNGLSEEQMIDVNIVNKDTPKKEEIKNGLYYTHPAFTAVYDDGSTYELNGFWIAKFEPSYNSQKEVLLLPGKDPIVNINTAQMWQLSLSIKNSYKSGYFSRMITNMEWGAIAYFSYSKYSKLNNDEYEGINKQIFINNAMGDADTWDNIKTGCSSGGVALDGAASCPYNYDVPYYGTGSSSTGNIYGIYDLVGGSWECTMSMVSGKNIKPTIGGYNGALPDDGRYYELYTASDMYDYRRGKIGDATREVISVNYDHHHSWNNNLAYFATVNNPWIKRGGTFRGGTGSGLFDFGITSANPRGDKTFRTILSAY